MTYGRKKFLWGNVPALDVINLACNEGESYAKDICLLYAGTCSPAIRYQVIKCTWLTRV